MSEYFYRGQPLSSYTLWDLGLIEKTIQEALEARAIASEHVKFNLDTKESGKVIKKINFPPPNVEFLKLKDAVEAEIASRQELQKQAIQRKEYIEEYALLQARQEVEAKELLVQKYQNDVEQVTLPELDNSQATLKEVNSND